MLTLSYSLIVEIVVLCLNTEEEVAPVVGYAEPQVKVEAEHAVASCASMVTVFREHSRQQMAVLPIMF